MTKEKKLTKVIETNIENGWEAPIHGEFKGVEEDESTGEYLAIFKELGDDVVFKMSAVLFLFHPKFAKAYWGEEDYQLTTSCDTESDKDGLWGSVSDGESSIVFFMGSVWQYYLQQAVLSKDLIDYYYKNVRYKLYCHGCCKPYTAILNRDVKVKTIQCPNCGGRHILAPIMG